MLCGKDSHESLYAGGSDAISIRTITDGMVLHIKTAFFNALQGRAGEGVADEAPAILVSLGLKRNDY